MSIDRVVSLDDFVTAFYTTPLFRSERLILGLFGMRSRDSDVDELLAGRRDSFAAWTVEDRTEDQLLMCDINQRTRSWFMVSATGDQSTRLWFGSAVTARGEDVPGSYRALLSFHRVYSRALLKAALRRLRRRTSR